MFWPGNREGISFQILIQIIRFPFPQESSSPSFKSDGKIASRHVISCHVSFIGDMAWRGIHDMTCRHHFLLVTLHTTGIGWHNNMP